MEFVFFMAIGAGLIALIFLIIGFAGRCTECGNLSHAFSSDKAADLTTGEAYLVCKKCGARMHKGTVAADGSVAWFAGGSGTFHKDGSYEGDSGAFGGDGGDGGGGGE